ncbi:MAG: epoxyqueuosine reductase QueH, partial [Deltaproteobacteria bacterium]|nr:epoxyqueuosine reductase QueH [Deltaproteobacteria bacterium]
MSVLLHICCGPCTVYPLEVFKSEGIKVRGFFFNPNIHPFQEFKKRLEAVKKLASQKNLQVDYQPEYGLRDYLRQVVFNEDKRCNICYDMRLLEAVEQAKKVRADAFTTTLLYSRYQNHELIRQKAEQLAEEHKISFYYHDFRKGWQQGIDISKEMGLY